MASTLREARCDFVWESKVFQDSMVTLSILQDDHLPWNPMVEREVVSPSSQSLPFTGAPAHGSQCQTGTLRWHRRCGQWGWQRERLPIKATTRKVWSDHRGSLVCRMESPSVICFRSFKVKFSAFTAMVSEQMNAMRYYSRLKPIHQTVLLLPDLFMSSCQTV